MESAHCHHCCPHCSQKLAVFLHIRQQSRQRHGSASWVLAFAIATRILRSRIGSLLWCDPNLRYRVWSCCAQRGSTPQRCRNHALLAAALCRLLLLLKVSLPLMHFAIVVAGVIGEEVNRYRLIHSDVADHVDEEQVKASMHESPISLE